MKTNKRTAFLVSGITGHVNCNCVECYYDPHSEGNSCKDENNFIRLCGECSDDTDCPGLNLCKKCGNPLFPGDNVLCKYCAENN